MPSEMMIYFLVLVLISTFMCLASLYIWNLHNLGYFEQSSQMNALDLVSILCIPKAIAVLLCIELLHDLIYSDQFIHELI